MAISGRERKGLRFYIKGSQSMMLISSGLKKFQMLTINLKFRADSLQAEIFMLCEGRTAAEMRKRP